MLNQHIHIKYTWLGVKGEYRPPRAQKRSLGSKISMILYFFLIKIRHMYFTVFLIPGYIHRPGILHRATNNILFWVE
jgi:hypothetical protein